MTLQDYLKTRGQHAELLLNLVEKHVDTDFGRALKEIVKENNQLAEKLGNQIFALETNLEVFINRIDNLNMSQLSVVDAIERNIEALKATKRELEFSGENNE